MGNVIDNNQITLTGEIISEFQFSHKVCGEGFYLASLKCKRLSSACDIIPIMVSDRLVDVGAEWTGQKIKLSGQLRSYNITDEKNQKNMLILSVFVREIALADQQCNDINEIFLDGYICKKPFYRKTPLGREISDIFIAVNRPYGKSDYIPCISWGRNARYATSLEVGSRLKIKGRLQSRDYVKTLDDGTQIEKTAYELSVSKMELVKKEG